MIGRVTEAVSMPVRVVIWVAAEEEMLPKVEAVVW